ncbi:hypothetical protein PR048_007311 [Dryococelus australis]|uniref:Uncharacterized protein n=1 Tax=Dryococelus australis TaxID=614101 RepID=A0ABQ9ID88_9NEOP|nr:hypothetical protein PR048_007311 [Dryococelus australis]
MQKRTVKHPDWSSAMRPVPNDKDLPVPQPPAPVSVEDEREDVSVMQAEKYATFEASASSSEPHVIIQCELNGHVHD